MESAMIFVSFSSEAKTSSTPRIVPSSLRPTINVPPAVFANAIRVLKIGLKEVRLSLNSSVLPSGRRSISSISNTFISNILYNQTVSVMPNIARFFQILPDFSSLRDILFEANLTLR